MWTRSFFTALYDHFRGKGRAPSARTDLVLVYHYLTNPLLVVILMLYVNSIPPVSGTPISKQALKSALQGIADPTPSFVKTIPSGVAGFQGKDEGREITLDPPVIS